MIEGLEARLAELATAGRAITYGALARDLAVSGPRSIAQLTEALEALMAEDAAAGRPFRAAVCEGRLTGGLPGPGFFVTARALGRMPAGADPAAYCTQERAALFKASQEG